MASWIRALLIRKGSIHGLCHLQWAVLLGSFCFCVPLQAQNESDALRYSTTAPVGTARSLALGGAFSAAGADLSSAFLNPAGLALYRGSQLTLTPAFRLINMENQYLEGRSNTSTQNFGISNWGVVFHNPLYIDNGREYVPVDKGLVSYTFAFGQNQVDNYYREIGVSSFNELSSITDMFAQWANGRDASQLEQSPDLAGIAFRTFLVDTLRNQTNQYFPAVNNGRVQQTARFIDEGRNNEWFLSLAGNIDDFLYVGLTVGIQSVRFERQFLFGEEDTENVHQFYQNDPNNPDFPLETPFNSLEYAETFSTRGTGINGKLGIILRATDYLRLGLSAQTPTYLSLTDEFSTRFLHNQTFSNGPSNLQEASEPGQFQYNLSTPFRFTFGGMYQFGKQGFLTADVEYTDYSSAKLSNRNEDLNNTGFDDFTATNNNIRDLFKSAVNVRLGGELRFNIFRLRAGGALHQTALTQAAQEYLDYPDANLSTLENPDRLILTFGMGIRQPNFNVDVTFVNQRQDEKLNPYSASGASVYVPSIISTRSANSVVMSVGFRL